MVDQQAPADTAPREAEVETPYPGERIETGPYAALVRGNFYRASKKTPYDRVQAVLEFAFPDGGEWGDPWKFAKDLLRPGRYFVLQEVFPIERKGEAPEVVPSA